MRLVWVAEIRSSDVSHVPVPTYNAYAGTCTRAITTIIIVTITMIIIITIIKGKHN